MRTPTSFRFLSVFFSEYLCLNNAIVKKNLYVCYIIVIKTKENSFFKEKITLHSSKPGVYNQFPFAIHYYHHHHRPRKTLFYFASIIEEKSGENFWKSQNVLGMLRVFFLDAGASQYYPNLILSKPTVKTILFPFPVSGLASPLLFPVFNSFFPTYLPFSLDGL